MADEPQTPRIPPEQIHRADQIYAEACEGLDTMLGLVPQNRSALTEVETFMVTAHVLQRSVAIAGDHGQVERALAAALLRIHQLTTDQGEEQP